MHRPSRSYTTFSCLYASFCLSVASLSTKRVQNSLDDPLEPGSLAHFRGSGVSFVYSFLDFRLQFLFQIVACF